MSKARVVCNIGSCGRTFANDVARRAHVKSLAHTDRSKHRFVCSTREDGSPGCPFTCYRKDHYDKHRKVHLKGGTPRTRRKPRPKQTVPVSPSCPLSPSTHHTQAYSSMHSQPPSMSRDGTQQSITAEYPVYGGEFPADQMMLTGAESLMQEGDRTVVATWMTLPLSHTQMPIDSGEPPLYNFEGFSGLPLPNWYMDGFEPSVDAFHPAFHPEFLNVNNTHGWELPWDLSEQAETASGWVHPATWENPPMTAVPADSLNNETINYSDSNLFDLVHL